MTWGNPDFGGDSSGVKDQLKGVHQVHATFRAFAAILEDGSVVTWSNPDCGGDSSGVKDQLKGVQQVLATDGAFAAILADGSVVTWGDRRFCSDSSGCIFVARSLQNCQDILLFEKAREHLVEGHTNQSFAFVLAVC